MVDGVIGYQVRGRTKHTAYSPGMIAENVALPLVAVLTRVDPPEFRFSNSTGMPLTQGSLGARPDPGAEHGVERTRVVLVDDHGVVRRGLRSYLGIFPDLEVVGEAGHGDEALAVLAQLAHDGRSGPPHVVLMDLAMSPMDGVTATREIRSRWPDIDVVVLTSFVDEERVHAALDAGASGYVLKDARPEEIALAIRAARRGEVLIDPAVTRRMMQSLRAGPPRHAPANPLADLTEREREVLDLIAEGLNNQDIARRLHLSERTARTHVSAILRKLGVASRTQAALVAVQSRDRTD